MRGYPSGNGFGGLVVIQVSIHIFLKFSMLGNPHTLILGIFSSNIGLMVGLYGIILAIYAIAFYLRENTGMTSFKLPSDSSN